MNGMWKGCCRCLSWPSSQLGEDLDEAKEIEAVHDPGAAQTPTSADSFIREPRSSAKEEMTIDTLLAINTHSNRSPRKTRSGFMTKSRNNKSFEAESQGILS